MSKKKKTKTNPRNKPATQADVKRAKVKAENLAIDKCWTITLTVLRDDFGFGKKRMRRFWEDVEKLSDEINKHEITIKDLAETIEKENHIVLEGALEDG